jgi:hypothetical protein
MLATFSATAMMVAAGCLLSWFGKMKASTMWEVFDAKYAQVRINDSCLRRGADAHGQYLPEKKRQM